MSFRCYNAMNTIKNQRGIVMLIGLMFVLILTLVGTMGIKMGQFQQKMSGGMRDMELSFQSSETALRSGELWLKSLTVASDPDSSCTPQPCITETDGSIDLATQSITWWAANSAQLSAGTLSQINTQPYYRIEFVSFAPDDVTIGYANSTGKYYYNITARGTGGTDQAVSVVQSTYVRRF